MADRTSSLVFGLHATVFIKKSCFCFVVVCVRACVRAEENGRSSVRALRVTSNAWISSVQFARGKVRFPILPSQRTSNSRI